MNYIEYTVCTQQEFEQVINSLEEGWITMAHDVGRTHRLICYQRKMVK
jgi:hypothetical protein